MPCFACCGCSALEPNTPTHFVLLLPVVVQIRLQLPGAPSSRAVAPEQPSLLQVTLGFFGLRMVPQDVIGHEALHVRVTSFHLGTIDGFGPRFSSSPMPPAHCATRWRPSLCFFSHSRSFDSDPADDWQLRDWQRMQLPHGTWYHNLTRLELPHAILAAPAVLAALQAATQLEELTVGRFSLPPQQPLPVALRFVAWAGALPRLARLTVGLSEGWSEVPPGMPRQYERSSRQGDTWSTDIEPAECMLQRQGLAAMGALATAALEAQARRPGLTIRIVSDAELHPDGQEGEWVPCSY